MYGYVCLCVYLYMCMCEKTHVCVFVYINMCIYMYIYVCIYIYIYICIYIYIYAYVCMYVYILVVVVVALELWISQALCLHYLLIPVIEEETIDVNQLMTQNHMNTEEIALGPTPPIKMHIHTTISKSPIPTKPMQIFIPQIHG